MLTAVTISLLTAAALTPPAPAAPELKLAEPLAGLPDRSALPFHLLVDTLRVPYGEDWGGDTFLYRPLNPRLAIGLTLRAWNEAICASPSCQDRAIEAGVELRYKVKPGLDLGVGVGAQRSAGVRPAPAVLPRLRLKF